MAVAWAALGILTAFALGVLGIFVSLLSRFDRQNDKFDRIDERFARVEERIDGSNEEHRAEIRSLGDRIERRIDEHEARRHAG
jgi:hypothetical protein